MDFDTFLTMVPAQQKAKSRRQTLALWCHIYSYIEQKGVADVVCDDDLIAHISQRKPLQRATITAHLRDMAECQILQANEMRVASGQGMGMLLNAFMGKPPTHRVLYTLPGQDPPKQVQRKRPWGEIPGILEREIKTLNDVTELRRWLSERHANSETLTAEQNERLKILVGDAIKLLRDTDSDIHRFYVSTALRSGLEPEIVPSESAQAAARQP